MITMPALPKTLLAIATSLLAFLDVNGEVFTRESFAYPEGTPLNTTSADAGRGWTSGWKADETLATDLPATVVVSEGSLLGNADCPGGEDPVGNHFRADTSGAVSLWRGMSRPIDWSTDSVTYISGIVRWDANHMTGASRIYYLIGDAYTRFGLGGNGEDADRLVLVLRSTGSSDSAQGTTRYAPNRSYLLVAKIHTHANADDVLSVALFEPGGFLPETEPQWELQLTHDRSDISAVFGFTSQLYAVTDTALDELRMGDTWRDVVGSYLRPPSDPSIVLGLDPVGYWPLNEGQGPAAQDLSPQNNDGIIRGVPWRDGFLDFRHNVFQWIEVPYHQAYNSSNFSC